MTRSFSIVWKNNVVAIFLVGLVTLLSVTNAKPATFLQDFRVTWSESHIKQLDGGKGIQLLLDQNSGCGFASKSKYLFGRVSMKIKLIPGDSAGTVTAFYILNSWGTGPDNHTRFKPMCMPMERVIENKGLTYGSTLLPISTRTPSFGTTTMLLDEVPIRVYKNNEAKGLPFPKMQPMGIYSTLWEADDWATRGGLEKIDWNKAPFYAYYKDFDIEGCPAPGPSACASNPSNWWEGTGYQQLDAVAARRYRWVRTNHMVYDYCTDKQRNPVTPPECMDGI